MSKEKTSNLRIINQYYLAFSIRDAVRPELSRTQYRIISRNEKPELVLQDCINLKLYNE